MELVELLIPDSILPNKVRGKYTNLRDKIEKFVRLFGVNPDLSPSKGYIITYDDSGHANTPFYVGEELTEEQVYNRLADNSIVSRNFLGKIKTKLLLNTKISKFFDKYEYYKFVRKYNPKTGIKYRLEWNSEYPY